MEKVEERYLLLLQNESLSNLGKSIFDFRSIGSNFIAGSVDKQLIKPIDDAYQAYFDKVLDEILNCYDLDLSKQMSRGLDKMMKTRRGFIKQDV